MSFETFLLSDVGSLPVKVGVAAVAGLALSIGLIARRSRKVEPAIVPKARPVSIETELQMDVKKRWKSRHSKQPWR